VWSQYTTKDCICLKCESARQGIKGVGLAARIDGERGTEYRNEIFRHQLDKRLDLLLHAIYCLSIGRFLKKPYSTLVLKIRIKNPRIKQT
jgi:hypothetical protein